MKRFFLLFALAITAAAAPAFADDDDVLYTSPDGKVTFDMFHHIGYGYHIVNSSDFKSNWSSEFFLNVVKVGVYPTGNLGIELGVDLDFNNFNSKGSAFIQDSGQLIQAVDFLAVETGNLQKPRGGFNTFGLSAPLLVKGIFGDFQLGVGAVATLNLTGDTYYHFRQDNRRTEISERKAKVNPFTYGILALLSYDDLGLYFKYYPKSSRLLPEGSVDLGFMTVGISICL